jgi:CheY-like chemotaxis protein
MHRFLELSSDSRKFAIDPKSQITVSLETQERFPVGAGSAVLSGHTILIVEDELMIRLALREHLEECGFAVLEAADAAEAMDLMERHDEIALVFSDVRMPGDMDGIDLAEWILKHWPGLPVMLTSGELGRISASEELSRAANVFAFSKPYRYGEISAKMILAIEKSPRG